MNENIKGKTLLFVNNDQGQINLCLSAINYYAHDNKVILFSLEDKRNEILKKLGNREAISKNLTVYDNQVIDLDNLEEKNYY